MISIIAGNLMPMEFVAYQELSAVAATGGWLAAASMGNSLPE